MLQGPWVNISSLHGREKYKTFCKMPHNFAFLLLNRNYIRLNYPAHNYYFQGRNHRGVKGNQIL